MQGFGQGNRLGGIGQAYGDRNFRVYSVGAIASWISFFVQLVAVSWLTWELTKSTTWLAVVALLDIVPNVVLMPLTGALADRVDRHRIMLATSFLSLLQASALAALAWWGLLSILPLAGLVLIHGVIISFMVPAMYGTLPRFVGRAALPSAIAVSSSYTQLAVFAGPALAGWIIAGHGTTTAFVVNAAGYLVLLISFLNLKTPAEYRQPKPAAHSIGRDILDGVAYLVGDRTILFLLLLGLVTSSLISGFYHMTPAYSEQVLGLGVVGLSTILACQGLGATGASLWLAHGGTEAVRLERVLWAAIIAMLALAALVLTENLYLAAAIAVVVGFAAETRRTSTMALIQLTVEEGQRGRVMGTLFMFSQLAAGIGAYVIGAVAADHGLRTPVLIGVAIGAVVWLVLYLYRERLFRMS